MRRSQVHDRRPVDLWPVDQPRRPPSPPTASSHPARLCTTACALTTSRA
jgi:hypothetical protein